jgi:hypothetical protein
VEFKNQETASIRNKRPARRETLMGAPLKTGKSGCQRTGVYQLRAAEGKVHHW